MHFSQPECFIILMGLRENPFKPSEVVTEELAIQSQKMSTLPRVQLV